jgi:hypothetical protein
MKHGARFTSSTLECEPATCLAMGLANATASLRTASVRQDQRQYCVLVLRTHPVGPVVKCFETETTPTDIEGLDGCGFTTEEIVSLLWLQHWYQTGGSDRVEPLRQWEFLKYLVLNGKLGR